MSVETTKLMSADESASMKKAIAKRDLTADDALDGGDVVPGWRLPLRELFE